MSEPFDSRHQKRVSPEEVDAAIQHFLSWKEGYGDISYDQFDYWATRLGTFGKALFLKNKPLAAPIVVPLQIMESFLPGLRVLFAQKRRFAIGDAHFALGYLNLFETTKNQQFLTLAEGHLNALMDYYTETPHGIGWGYPYVWHTQYHTFQVGEPVITVTPYVFNAFKKHFELTGAQEDLEILKRIVAFVHQDMNDARISDDVYASSYGPHDQSRVVNAIAYRAATLAKASRLLERPELADIARRNINFVLQSQNDDGSWLYAEDSRFIDNFHTSFVMNKSFECYQVFQDQSILESIRKGYEYYRRELVRADGTLKHFKQSRFPKFRKIEMYDYAEAISFSVLAGERIEGAREFGLHLAADLIHRFQVPDGFFVTRVSVLGTRNRVPYLRWPQAQLFFALTNLAMDMKR